MAAKKCNVCGESKLTKHFSRRKDRRKKDGSVMYFSTCHQCRREREQLRAKEIRDLGDNKCEVCDKKIGHDSNRCMEHRERPQVYEKGKRKPIDKKWLVRGPISDQGRTSNITSCA